jgi:hypothetical protein
MAAKFSEFVRSNTRHPFNNMQRLDQRYAVFTSFATASTGFDV